MPSIIAYSKSGSSDNTCRGSVTAGVRRAGPIDGFVCSDASRPRRKIVCAA